MNITSPKNPLIQEIRRAASAGRPLEDGSIVLEGPHLLAEAVRSRWTVEQVLVSPAGSQRVADLIGVAGANVLMVAERALEAASDTEHSQGVLALARPHAWRPADILREGALAVVLDGIQDPGNAGTIIRCAEAFGAAGVLLLRGSVRVANGKFLRATAGSILRLPHVEDLSVAEARTLLADGATVRYALSADGTLPIDGVPWKGGCALIVGNEGRGVSPELMAVAQTIRIPVKEVESLNAAVACSIALYEASRQREAK
jgi:RNA methyltransferase, TrmH family